MTIINLNLTKDEFIESQWQELFSCGIRKLPDNNLPFVQFKNLSGDTVTAINEKYMIAVKEDNLDNNLKKLLIVTLFSGIKSELLGKSHNCISIRRSIEIRSFQDYVTGDFAHKVCLRMLSCKDADEEDFKANCFHKMEGI